MQSTLFSLVAFTLAAGVITAIAAEFLRGAQRGAHADGQESCCASMVLLVRRNTRRYGGYIVHFGIVVMFIGIAGGAFNQSREKEMGFGDSMTIGPYNWSARHHAGLEARTTTPSMRCSTSTGTASTSRSSPRRSAFYRRQSQTASTIVALHSTAGGGPLHRVRGKNPDTRPADHQGVSESADCLDLDWRGDRGGWAPSLRWCRTWYVRRCDSGRRIWFPLAL